MNRYGSAWAAAILTIVVWGHQPLPHHPTPIPIEVIEVRSTPVIPPHMPEEEEEVLTGPKPPIFRIPIGSPAEKWYVSTEKDGPRIVARWHKMITHALSAHGSDLPPEFIASIMLSESMGDPRAKNKKTDARGLLGIRRIVCEELNDTECNRFDPYENLSLGIRYLEHLQQKYGFENEDLMLAHGTGPTGAKKILSKQNSLSFWYVHKILFAWSVIGPVPFGT